VPLPLLELCGQRQLDGRRDALRRPRQVVQLLYCDGYWSCARPKALRWGLFHAPGRIVRTARRNIVRILEHWPQAGILLRAYRQIEAIT